MGTRILVASDLHGSLRGAANLGSLADRFDASLVIISGDITNFQMPDVLPSLMAAIGTEVLAVTGNCDSLDVVHALPSTPMVTPLNGNVVRRGGWNFCGYSYNDIPIQEVLPIVPRERLVLVTHVPPLGVNDRSGIGHTGDGRITEWIEENRPALVISGHIHEARGIVKRGRTVYVNPGPARDNLAAVVEVGETSVVDASLL